MKFKKPVTMLTAVFLVIFIIAGCGGGGASTTTTAAATTAAAATTTAAATTAATTTKAAETTTAAAASSGERQAPPEGKDTNNGRPYNLTKIAWDNRQEKYLNGINATILPIVEEPKTVTIWLPFSSTVVTDVNETEVFKELRKRTNIVVEWLHPPQGQNADNFNLLVASDNLPDVFGGPPDYPGGPAKAIADEIYVDLTPYYNRNLMPNVKYLMESRNDLYRDFVDDEGHYLSFKGIDIVPTSPWSGLWVRQDWLDDLNLPEPKTIDDWDVMLKAMQESKTPNPLNFNLVDGHGVKNNYEFAAGYETGWGYIRKNGNTVEYGPTNDGYLPFLTKMHEWYVAGYIDPDFPTRTYDDYISNTINGLYGALGMSYGDVGPLMLGGKAQVPAFQLKPVLQPTTYDGQTIHLRQGDEIVRSSNTYMAYGAIDRGIDDIVVQYLDYWYSQDGGDLFSMGPEGVSYEWNDEGTYTWIYPDLVNNPDADFWTIMNRFKSHYIQTYLRDSAAYENLPEVWECIDYWTTQLDDWRMPYGITQTTDEAKELADIEVDFNTYRDEMAYRFITGQSPLSEFNAYMDQMKKLNVARAVEIKQAALDRYFAR